MKEKPYIVQLAEFLSGYSGSSKEQDETLRHLQARAKALNEELRTYKSECEKLNGRISETEDKIGGLENLLQEKNQEIDTLSKQLYESTDQLKKVLERYNTLSKDLEIMSDKQNTIVGYIMSAIQNSEIFSGSSFSKEQVIQFLNTQLEQLLSVLDIEIYEDINVPLNPLFHKIEATQYTEEITKEGLISKSFGKGFRIGERCIQEQPVEIFTHNL